uniref:Major histocompatibility complex class I LBA n=1 Tax=Sinocyclocheilus grahami TaxID=75366 RepID=A0A672MTH2_SINGR
VWSLHVLSTVQILYACPCVSTGSHSLMALATYIVGQTQFPEFSVVVMLDDVQIAYYDSTTWKSNVLERIIIKSHFMLCNIVNMNMMNKECLISFHSCEGVQVLQRLAGCELLNYDKPGPQHFSDGFSGQNMEEFTFDMEKHDIQMKMPWMITWNQLKWLKFLQQFLYFCVVKPRVRLMKKTLTDSQGLQISCLATGFYPRHINLTLFRDGQPVEDDQITGGEILPNGDGTYQMRKSLVISEEELHEEHKYNCTMKHLNLDNKLDIVYVFSVLVFMCVVVLIITALIIWRKRRAAGKYSVKSN